MTRQEPTRSAYKLGDLADVADLPNTAEKVASIRNLFPPLTQLPVSSGGAYPRREDINALFKSLGAAQYFIESGGVFSYDAARATAYAPGDLVWWNAGGAVYDPADLNTVISPPGDAMLYMRIEDLNASAPYTPTITSGAKNVVNVARWEPVLTYSNYNHLRGLIENISPSQEVATVAELKSYLIDWRPRCMLIEWDVPGALESDYIVPTIYDANGDPFLNDEHPRLPKVGNNKWVFSPTYWVTFYPDENLTLELEYITYPYPAPMRGYTAARLAISSDMLNRKYVWIDADNWDVCENAFNANPFDIFGSPYIEK